MKGLLPPKKAPDKEGHDRRRYRHAAYSAEAAGLLVMAVVLLLFIVIRYWRTIPWGAR